MEALSNLEIEILRKKNIQKIEQVKSEINALNEKKKKADDRLLVLKQNQQKLISAIDSKLSKMKSVLPAVTEYQSILKKYQELIPIGVGISFKQKMEEKRNIAIQAIMRIPQTSEEKKISELYDKCNKEIKVCEKFLSEYPKQLQMKQLECGVLEEKIKNNSAQKFQEKIASKQKTIMTMSVITKNRFANIHSQEDINDDSMGINLDLVFDEDDNGNLF